MQPKRHRTFDFLYTEICVAIGRRASRYDLWLLVWEVGADPGGISRDQVRHFVEQRLDFVFATEGVQLSPRAQRRLQKRLLDFDPRYPTPEEWLGRLDGRPS